MWDKLCEIFYKLVTQRANLPVSLRLMSFTKPPNDTQHVPRGRRAADEIMQPMIKLDMRSGT